MTHRNESLSFYDTPREGRDKAYACTLKETLASVEAVTVRILDRIMTRSTLTNVGGPFHGRLFRVRASDDGCDVFIQIMSIMEEGDLRLEKEVILEDLLAPSNNKSAKENHVLRIAQNRWVSDLLLDKSYADQLGELVLKELEVRLTQALERAIAQPAASENSHCGSA
jgi:hypothetical protein